MITFSFAPNNFNLAVGDAPFISEFVPFEASTVGGGNRGNFDFSLSGGPANGSAMLELAILYDNGDGLQVYADNAEVPVSFDEDGNAYVNADAYHETGGMPGDPPEVFPMSTVAYGVIVLSATTAGDEPFTGPIGFNMVVNLIYLGENEPVPAVEAPAIPESLMTELRGLYLELVKDTSTNNDRQIYVYQKNESRAANGQRVIDANELIMTTYGQVKYLSQSAATRELGRPTGETVVEITIPYLPDLNIDAYFYRVSTGAQTEGIDVRDYFPIPGENNRATAFRVYTRFLARARE